MLVPHPQGGLARRLSTAGELLAHRIYKVNIAITDIIDLVMHIASIAPSLESSQLPISTTPKSAGQRGCIDDLHRPAEPVWVDGGGKPGRVRQPCLSKPTTCHVPSTVSSVPQADHSDRPRDYLSRPSRNQTGDFERAPPSAVRAIFG